MALEFTREQLSTAINQMRDKVEVKPLDDATNLQLSHFLTALDEIILSLPNAAIVVPGPRAWPWPDVVDYLCDPRVLPTRPEEPYSRDVTKEQLSTAINEVKTKLGGNAPDNEKRLQLSRFLSAFVEIVLALPNTPVLVGGTHSWPWPDVVDYLCDPRISKLHQATPLR